MEIICEGNPEHKKNVCVDNGVKLLYLCLLKDLYGFMDYALLSYDLYSKTLKSHGFAFNPYDRSIANSTINGKKFTIAWYVDNNKVFHIDKEVNTISIDTIAEHFGDFTVSRGKKQKFLGLFIEFFVEEKYI